MPPTRVQRVAPTKRIRKAPTHAIRRPRSSSGSETNMVGTTTAKLRNTLVQLHGKIDLEALLAAGKNTVIGNDPGPNNGVITLLIVGKEGIARSHGLCVPMKVDLFQEVLLDKKQVVKSTVQACRDRMAAWIRQHRWVTRQACLVIIERQLIATGRKNDDNDNEEGEKDADSESNGKKKGGIDFANQKNNTLATTVENKWEDIVINEATGQTLPIFPISKESFHFAYPDIFPVPPKGVNAHDYNKGSVIHYAEETDSLLCVDERQWVEADFTRNYYGQLGAGKRQPKTDADDYYDADVFALGALDHATEGRLPSGAGPLPSGQESSRCAEPPDSAQGGMIAFRKNNKASVTVELFVCPAMELAGAYELFSDENRLMLVFQSEDDPLLRHIVSLYNYAFEEGAVLTVRGKNRLARHRMRRAKVTLLKDAKTSSDLYSIVDLTHE